MKKQINIALCMNTQEESKNLELQFLEINSEIKVYLCDGLNELVECVTKNNINCFVFEYNCQKFNTEDIASKLEKTAKFKSASFIFVTDREKISEVYEVLNLKIDMVITRPFKKIEYAPHLSCI